MSQLAVIAVDVGGTTVDAACISAAGGLIGEVVESASPAAGTKDEIVAELARAVAAARAQAGDITVTACAIAMPAPFDYAAGVSHMEHKFKALSGVNLGRLLRAVTGLPTYFINDADAFGLGVSWRQLPAAERFIGLTIGTGRGGRPAVEAYRAMGTAIGRGLAPVLLRFKPELLVIGGKVGQSLPLFGPAAGRALAEAGPPRLPIIPAG